MIWTMSKNISNIVENCKERQRSSDSIGQAMDHPTGMKRKREDDGSAMTSPARESPTVHRPETRRTIDKKELKILRMQIAMISDADGDRPIHVAVAQENLALVQKLCSLMLKTAISIDLTNYLRQTPLHLAVMLGNVEMVRLLLKCGSSLILRDRNGNSVLHLAVKTNVKKDLFGFILSHPLATTILNALDHEGYTALHYAVLKKNKMAVTCLQISGANMNAIDGKSGRTPLIHAILERNSDMVSHLLKCGANPEIVDYSGRSASELALQASTQEIVKLLEKQLLMKELSKSSSSEVLKEGNTVIHRTKKLKEDVEYLTLKPL